MIKAVEIVLYEISYSVETTITWRLTLDWRYTTCIAVKKNCGRVRSDLIVIQRSEIETAEKQA